MLRYGLQTRLLVLALSSVLAEATKLVDLKGVEQVGLSTAQIAQQRGFGGENHTVITQDGYILNLVRLSNPLLKNRRRFKHKSVVLFIHGSMSSANAFLTNSEGVKPKDYTRYNASNMSQSTLNKLLAKEPAGRSLPFLLLDFGHDVWLVNRRGTFASLGRTNGVNGTAIFYPSFNLEDVQRKLEEAGGRLSAAISDPPRLEHVILDILADLTQLGTDALNSDYWKYSLDEQVKYDLPALIDHIRRQTGGSRVSVVGHSAGGAITAMALAERPKLADKLGQILLWAPAVGSGNVPREAIVAPILNDIIRNIVGPFIPLEVLQLAREALLVTCSAKSVQRTLCMFAINFFVGFEGKHQMLSPGFLYEFLGSFSTWELAHLSQDVFYDGFRHYFDFTVEEENLKAYGSPEPPIYDFSKVRAKTISLYAGKTDRLVDFRDVVKLADQFSAPVDFQLLGNPDDQRWNHISYLVNDDAGEVINIPSLMKLERGLKPVAGRNRTAKVG